MIIKIATGKDENGNIKWTHLYSEAIRNRLRRDLNLADIPDPAEARKNLGIEAYVAEVADDLYSRLKQYIDKQDIHYHDILMTYIKNNIETELEAHTERLNEIEKTMVTKEAFDTYFQVSWDKRVPELKKELQSYTDDKISVLDTSLREYINGQVSSLSNRIVTLETKVGTLETKVGTLETKVGTLETKVTNMITNLNTNFTAISTDLDGIYNDAGTELSRLEKEIQKTNEAMKIMATIDERAVEILGSKGIATTADDKFFQTKTNEAKALLYGGGATGSPPKARTYRYQVTTIS